MHFAINLSAWKLDSFVKGNITEDLKIILVKKSSLNNNNNNDNQEKVTFRSSDGTV